MSTEVRLKGARIAFTDNLFVAGQYQGKGDFKFKSTFLMEKDSENLKAIKAAMLKEATAKWGEKAGSVLKSITGNANKCGLQDGDSKDYEGFAGMAYISASSKVKPRIVDRDGKTVLEQSDGKPYAGCYVNAVVECFASTNTGNGVYFSLKGVMFAKDGDGFGGGAPLAEDAFSDLAEQGENTPASTGSDVDFGA